VKEPTGVGVEEKEAILSSGSAEVGIHGGVGVSISENDGVAGEPDGESGGDGGVGWLERVIPLCPYALKSPSPKNNGADLSQLLAGMFKKPEEIAFGR
jgi:hypothetical protein